MAKLNFSIRINLLPTISTLISPQFPSLLRRRANARNISYKYHISQATNIPYQEKHPGMLVFVDFKKTFDSIEWPFKEKTLTYYSFGKSFISWTKLFYTDISSCVQTTVGPLNSSASPVVFDRAAHCPLIFSF